MEIKIGIRQVNREVVVDSAQSAADLQRDFAEALETNGLLSVTDTNGRKVLIPAAAIGYVDIGEENARRVGFGTV